jgi:hypothetical protein
MHKGGKLSEPGNKRLSALNEGEISINQGESVTGRVVQKRELEWRKSGENEGGACSPPPRKLRELISREWRQRRECITVAWQSQNAKSRQACRESARERERERERERGETKMEKALTLSGYERRRNKKPGASPQPLPRGRSPYALASLYAVTSGLDES